MSLRKHLAGAALFLLILSTVLMYWQFNPRPRHPSDEALMANFREHRAAFEKLIRMTDEDRNLNWIFTAEWGDDNYVVSFSDNTAWPRDCSSCFSIHRWAEYRTAFANLGNVQAHSLSKKDGRVGILISFASTDLDANYEYLVSEKGYLYSLTEPPGVVQSLDGMGFATKGTFYKKIANHWYLYHEWGVGKPE